MDRTHLTVELVEAFQTMESKGRPINTVVQNLCSATLAGILEYGCLRYALNSSVPPLPEAIVKSAIGRTLYGVPSKLGLRDNGPAKPRARDVGPREIEFMTISTPEQSLELAWDNFLQRFEGAAKRIGFSIGAAANLQSALHEMATNAVIHARSPVAALVGYQVADSAALFSVVDMGRGVLASLTANPKYAYLTEPVDAIQKALSTGVTGDVGDDGGYGFDSVFKALAEQWGQLRLRSGNGCITMDGTDVSVDQSVRTHVPPLPGFQVSVCCRVDGCGSLASVL